jgi:hypothetical protein
MDGRDSCLQKSFVEDAWAIHLAMRVGLVVFWRIAFGLCAKEG